MATIIKLADGTKFTADTIDLTNGILKITTSEDIAVEELATLFKNTLNTSLITLMTESEIESGFKSGFTSFAGITYNEDGSKTIEMYQPVDATEQRIANAEAIANSAVESANAVAEQNEVLTATVDSILIDIIPALSE